MFKKSLNKIENLINQIKNDISIEIISNFLNWFYDKINIHFNKEYDNNLKPKKGDIYFVNLGINIGNELNKNRPCIVYSDSKFNGGNNLIILPIKTYKNSHNKNFNLIIYPDNINNLIKTSIVSIINIKEVSKKRFVRKIGKVSKNELVQIDKKLARILAIKKEEL